MDQDVTNYPIYLRTKKFQVGYVPQYGGFFNDLTLHDNLKAISEIVIDNKNYRSERIDYLISKFELDNLKEIKDSTNFFVNGTNQEAFDIIKNKSLNSIFLNAPNKSGKSHPVNIWVENNNAILYCSNLKQIIDTKKIGQYYRLTIRKGE